VLDPNTMLDLQLPAGAYDIVLRALAEMPYRLAAPVIETLKQQVVAVHPQAFDQVPPPLPEVAR